MPCDPNLVSSASYTIPILPFQIAHSLVISLEMMMSVLQEVEGLTKELYFITLPIGRQVSMQNFKLNVCTALPALA